jgi:hypothetical protein
MVNFRKTRVTTNKMLIFVLDLVLFSTKPPTITTTCTIQQKVVRSLEHTDDF